MTFLSSYDSTRPERPRTRSIFTSAGLAHGGKLRFERGGLEGLHRWEPALRALFHGRPIWSEQSAAGLVDASGAALDLSRTFSPEDSDAVAKIQEEILDVFFEKLNDSETVDKEMIDGLRALLSSDNKLKADEIAAVFTVDPAASDD